nr:MAG TPA: hypothetical protein [Caudoviricetes sp.]
MPVFELYKWMQITGEILRSEVKNIRGKQNI